LFAAAASGSGRHWLHIEAPDNAGRNELIGSPIYINFPEN
jgi:hypothetical protein